MNIFVVDRNPIKAARMLPEKHVVKMPLETCQMLAIVYSKWYLNWGEIHKKDGTPYRTAHGAFRNHPCTQWAASHLANLAWLIVHGNALCCEYRKIYGKIHGCDGTIKEAIEIFNRRSSYDLSCYLLANSFAQAMPDSIKMRGFPVIAYQRYLNTKDWVSDNYSRQPERKPTWISA